MVIASFWRITSGGFPRGTARSSIVGGVQHAAANTIGERPNRILVIQLSASVREEAKVLKAHAATDNLVNALKFLANQQKDGDSPIESMDGLRNFIEVDNLSAVDVGGLRRGTKSIRVKKPQFSEAFPEAVSEGADELTLRAGKVASLRTFIDTKHTELVDTDWHAFCQAIYKGIEGQEWEALYYYYKELQGAHWKMKAARDRDDEFF